LVAFGLTGAKAAPCFITELENAVGGESEEMKLEHRVVIEKPVDLVFEYVTNPENNPKWQSNISELYLKSEGPLGEGTSFFFANKFLGQRFETEVTITEYQPRQVCSFRFNTGKARGVSCYLFEPVNGGTRLTAKADLDLEIFKVAKFIAKHMARAQLKNDMTALKRILENGG
jgi:uncharacterized membrane protein